MANLFVQDELDEWHVSQVKSVGWLFLQFFLNLSRNIVPTWWIATSRNAY